MIDFGNGVGFPSNDLTADFGQPGQVSVRFNRGDGTPYKAVKLLNLTGSTTTVGRPYAPKYSGAVSGNLQIAVPTTATTGVLENLGFGAYVSTTSSGMFATTRIVIALEATPTNTCGWFAVEGYVDGVLVDGSGTSIAVGDVLKLAPSTSSVALVQDIAAASYAGFTQPPRGVGIAHAATSAAATAIRVFLWGDPVDVSP